MIRMREFYLDTTSSVFVIALDPEVTGQGVVKVDIAWGGMIYAVVHTPSMGLKVESSRGCLWEEAGR
jgi:proline racemase